MSDSSDANRQVVVHAIFGLIAFVGGCYAALTHWLDGISAWLQWDYLRTLIEFVAGFMITWVGAVVGLMGLLVVCGVIALVLVGLGKFFEFLGANENRFALIAFFVGLGVGWLAWGR